MTQAQPSARGMAWLCPAFYEKALRLSRHEQADGCLWGGERSEMDSQDNVICAWAWAGLNGLRN